MPTRSRAGMRQVADDQPGVRGNRGCGCINGLGIAVENSRWVSLPALFRFAKLMSTLVGVENWGR